MGSLIFVEDIHRSFDIGVAKVAALRGLSFSVEAGEFLAVMGASGSGKSTLLNILGCLDRPSQGKYLLDGTDVSRLSPDDLAQIRNRKIGFVFQSFNLLHRTTALENVELPMLYSDVSSGESRRRGEEGLSLVGLWERREHYPSQLSGGEQQRVAMARALVNHPILLLADELTGNLDSKTSTEIMEILQVLNRDRGLTIVLITHDPNVARYAGRRLLIKDGLIQDGGR